MLSVFLRMGPFTGGPLYRSIKMGGCVTAIRTTTTDSKTTAPRKKTIRSQGRFAIIARKVFMNSFPGSEEGGLYHSGPRLGVDFQADKGPLFVVLFGNKDEDGDVAAFQRIQLWSLFGKDELRRLGA